MRIPFPQRILYSHALIFATVLCSVQILERTNPFFSGLCFCFILVATAAFNIAGGMPYPSGVFIAANAIFTLVMPLVVKAFLREPADSNLHVPMRTLEVYLAGMVAMFAGAVVTRRFRARRSPLVRLMPMTDIRGAYLGSLVLGTLLTFVNLTRTGNSPGSISSFLVQINRFPELAMLLGPIATVYATAGRRSLSPSNIFLIVLMSATGLLGFSKEAFLVPFFCWAVAAAITKYRLSWINIIVFLGGGYLCLFYMIPYAQIGRDYENPDLSPTQISVYLLTHFSEVREAYDAQGQDVATMRYYNERLPLLDRLDVLSVDDPLIELTDREGTFGYQPVAAAVDNFVPHFLWPNKPIGYYGNTYAHQLGFLADADLSTGISFSPSADAYHEGRMVGVLVVETAVFIVCFLLIDSLIGDVRQHPVGLLMTVFVFRLGSEGLLTGLIYVLAQPLAAIYFAAFFCAFVLPVVSTAFARRQDRSSVPPAGLALEPSRSTL